MVWLADAYITDSQGGKDYLIDVLHARPDRVFLQPYEIPDERSLPGSGAVEGDLSSLQRPVFLFVGHVIPRKGLPVLLQACATLGSRGYTNYTLLVVGNGSQEEELKAFCQEHGLSDRIQWIGRVPYDQLAATLRALMCLYFQRWKIPGAL
jgi:glycosyltransferase involved in cell wall biosynthesis